MKFKIRITEKTVLEDIINELDKIKYAPVKVIPLNYIRKITVFLEIEEIKGKGSSVRFRHELLVEYPNFHDGIFQVHRVHKGGGREEIRKSDFVRYLDPVLRLIIELLKNK